ncbi:MAG: hypothetical protein U5L75_02745 [Candidatus Campbellbacteria bacterium]|nr:hypothetical protein [Candidatus Campbellbacteria bacterium]
MEGDLPGQIAENLESINVSEFITPQLLWWALLAVLVLFAVISSILVFHWRKYALGKEVVRRMIIIYFSVSGVFILSLVLLILSITL